MRLKAIKRISLLGTGWLGMPLAERLINIGYVVKGSTTSSVRLAELTQASLQPFVINLETPDQNPSDFFNSNTLIINIPNRNILGFTQLINLIEYSPIQHVLFISSTSVYASSNQTIKESDSLEIESKPLRQIEKLFIDNPNFKTTIVRFGGLIGGSRHPGKFFKRGVPAKNPRSFVNLIHLDDCINIIEQLIEKDIWQQSFNCCSDSHPTKRDFYTKAASSCGLNKPIFEEAAKDEFKIISNSKIKKYLNYRFVHHDLMKLDFNRLF